jgi:hypothetical protein
MKVKYFCIQKSKQVWGMGRERIRKREENKERAVMDK